jgi:hypothetical protein
MDKQKKLIGKQKKLDRNHNGKLDSQDFKMLRAGKIKEQFMDRVIGILYEMRVDEISSDLAAKAAIQARTKGKHSQARKLIQGADKRYQAEKKMQPK